MLKRWTCLGIPFSWRNICIAEIPMNASSKVDGVNEISMYNCRHDNYLSIPNQSSKPHVLFLPPLKNQKIHPLHCLSVQNAQPFCSLQNSPSTSSAHHRDSQSLPQFPAHLFPPPVPQQPPPVDPPSAQQSRCQGRSPRLRPGQRQCPNHYWGQSSVTHSLGFFGFLSRKDVEIHFENFVGGRVLTGVFFFLKW